MLLNCPEGMNAISIEQQEFKALNGVIDVPDVLVPKIMATGLGFVVAGIKAEVKKAADDVKAEVEKVVDDTKTFVKKKL